MDLNGKIIVITGGASGIGAALARRFAQEGPAGIALLDLSADNLAPIAEELGALPIALDCGDRAQLEAALERVETELGPIDLCCSNAGIGVDGGAELPVDEWQRIWDINLMAHVHAAGWLIPRMIERGGGYLLNTASAAGLLTQIGSAPYAVTKAAAVALGEWLAITHGADGIGVSVLCPQAVNTPMIANLDAGGVAGVDGVIEATEVADAVVAGLAAEQFLILPHPVVAEYVNRKAGDRDRWIKGMRRLQAQYGDRNG